MKVQVSMCVDRQATVDKFAQLIARLNSEVCTGCGCSARVCCCSLCAAAPFARLFAQLLGARH